MSMTSCSRGSARASLRPLSGCDGQDQIRLATAVSEIARNAFQYGGGGTVEFRIDHVQPGDAGVLVARVSDSGPGIPNAQAVLNGDYVSPTGMGLGIIGARRLVDSFTLASSRESGTDGRTRAIAPIATGASDRA